MRIVKSGKRKMAVAKATLTEGTGKITINKYNYKNLHVFDKLKIEEPLRIYQELVGPISFDVAITVRSGGEKGQVEASRVALSRAIIEFAKSSDLKKAFIDYDRSLLVADVRRKETYKPGDSKARRKRQKSYR